MSDNFIAVESRQVSLAKDDFDQVSDMLGINSAALLMALAEGSKIESIGWLYESPHGEVEEHRIKEATGG
jgi:hypothetical protein